MPHTSTRHRKPRRHNLPSADGWTHVSYTSSPSRAAAAIAAHALLPTPSSNDAGRTGFYTPDPSLTASKLATEFATYLERWRASAARDHVRRSVQRLLARRRPVDAAVCLALGAVAREARWRTMWQLAAFVDLAGLCREGRGRVRVALQEPWLVPLDRGLLEGLGVEVLDARRDEALESLGEGTVVFCPFMERGEERRYRDRAREVRVAGYVSTPSSAAGGEEGEWEGYEVVKWPVWEEQGMALEGLVMYLRRDGDEDGDGEV